MPEYRRQTSGPSAGGPQSRTVFQRPESAVQATFGEAGKKLVGEAIRGGVAAKQQQDYTAAMGDPGADTLAALVDFEEQNPNARNLSVDEYQKMGLEHAEKTGASIRQMAAYADKGLVSGIAAEAYSRKKLAAIASNPFYAAFNEAATELAGPLAGGTDKQLKNLIAGSPEMAALQEQSEQEAKAKAEENVAKQMVARKTGWSLETVDAKFRNRALFEQRQLDAAVDVTEATNRIITKSQLDFEDMFSNSLDETNKLPAAAKSNLGQWIATNRSKLLSDVSASGLSDKDKAAKLSLIEKRFKGMEEMVASADKSAFITDLMKELDQKQEMEIMEKLPLYVFMQNRDPAAASALLYTGHKMIGSEVQRLLGTELSQAIEENVLNFSRMMRGGATSGDSVPFLPSPEVGEYMGSPEAATAVEKVFEKGEETQFLTDVTRQAIKHPTETLRGINTGPILKSANKGSESAQATVHQAAKALVSQVRSEMSLLGAGNGETPITIVTRSARGGPRGFLNIPDSMSDRSQELMQFYKTLRSSQWMWPEGATSAKEAFSMVLNLGAELRTANGEGAGSLQAAGGGAAPRMGGQKTASDDTGAAKRGYATEPSSASDAQKQRFLNQIQGMSPTELDGLRTELEEDAKSFGTPRTLRALRNEQLQWLDEQATAVTSNPELTIQTDLPTDVAPQGKSATTIDADQPSLNTVEGQGLGAGFEYIPEAKGAFGVGEPIDASNLSIPSSEAVQAVEKREGSLTAEQRIVVDEEGYRDKPYKDTKGVVTTGVGQTGKWAKKTFKETFDAHRADAVRLIPDLDKMPEDVRGYLISATYRGMLQKSPKTVSLINAGKYKEAAVEYLNAKDYREAVLENTDGDNVKDGVQFRMEREARAIAKLAGGSK